MEAHLERYKNLSGDSGVTAYEIRKDALIVRFQTGAVYLYSYKMPGRFLVEKMKKLAVSGKGLATFISRFIRDHYEKELNSL